MNPPESDAVKNGTAPETPPTAPELQHEPVSSAFSKPNPTRFRAEVKKMGLHVVAGVAVFLVSVLIAALANFFYGETREAKNALTLEKERNQRLERDLADLSKLQQTDSADLAATKAALISEKEKGASSDAHVADLSKRIATLTERMALVQQVLVAPDATLVKAQQAMAERQRRSKATKLLTGDDLTFLVELFDAPGELQFSRELTAATVHAYESRIQTVDSIVRSALAAEKHLSPISLPEQSPRSRN
ncbi:MAG TPA: hypothetical protein VM940_09130 [Chthoniobacterales bacterium]|jgi:hypothetical protein|nr:hypothetical protein [Chthoniobacterales bacterium]